MAQPKQTIRFSLKENKLVSAASVPCAARAHGYKTVGREEMFSRMAGMNAAMKRLAVSGKPVKSATHFETASRSRKYLE